MGGKVRAVFVVVLVLSMGADGGLSVPAGKQIKARVVRVLAAPDSQTMHMPTDVAVDAAGRAFVTDGVNDRVIRFTPEGQVDLVIAKPGGQRLNRPIGLTIDAANRLWIADTGNHRLIVATAEGKLVETIDLPKTGTGRSADPTGLAVTRDGKRTYIVDNDNHRLLVRQNDTSTWKSLGRKGRALGQFQWPFMVCIGQEGYVYISEVLGARLQRVSPTDRWAGRIGRWGVELGRLYRPKGVVTDASGRLYVADSTSGAVQAFGAAGSFEGVLTDGQGAVLRFRHPMGLAMGPRGALYVVELSADRVAVVMLGGAMSSETKPTGQTNKEDVH